MTEGALEPAAKSGRDANPDSSTGLFGRIARYFRQVVDEMKKVVYPTGEELWRYFLVVVFFVLVIMAAVAVIDLGFSALTDLVFR